MSVLSSLLWMSVWMVVSAQTLETITLNGTKLLYYKVERSTPAVQRKGVIIFLHGSVSAYAALEQPTAISLDSLLESNDEFLPTAQRHGYDVLLPIAYREYTWLKEPGQQLVLALQDKQTALGEEVVISGFSDGATGAFQLLHRHPDRFAAALIFNGYPQHANFNRNLNHQRVSGKTILFASSRSDRRIPYEFLLVEYRRQKMRNAHTYFSLIKGGHRFSAYRREDLEPYFEVLEMQPVDEESAQVYPPIDGWVVDGEIRAIYPFRKKYGRQFGMVEQEYSGNATVFRRLKGAVSRSSPITIAPVQLSEEALESAQEIEFLLEVDGQQQPILLPNWLRIRTWN